MEKRALRAREILEAFLIRWPLDHVRRMTLEEYVDTGNPDTFCQWLETQTRELGSIKGFYSNKFGIYRPQEHADSPDRLNSDGVYNWISTYGDDRRTAFSNVKAAIIDTIVAADAGNLAAIDAIHLNSLVKWKIASLYGNEQVIPLFKRGLLEEICKDRKMPPKRKWLFSEMLSFLYDLKPADTNIYEYTYDLLREFNAIPQDDTARYYIIGCKYGEHDNIDMFPTMEADSVVCTGFSWGHNLSHLYGATRKKIAEELAALKEEPKSYNALSHFLQLKPGDIVAVKSTGSPKGHQGYLEIIAYAVVVQREGTVYYHDPVNLGHCIHVEYIKTGIKKSFNKGGYGRTIHAIEKKDMIDLFFADYKSAESKPVRKKIRQRRRTRRPATEKNTEGQKRKGSEGYVTNARHNNIQQLFRDYLVELYGEDCVFLEDNNVDIKVCEPRQITLYEVKPYDLPEDCIRAGIGQLLSYACFDTDPRKKIIKIVGPNEPDEDDTLYIKYLKKNLNLNFDYEPFKID